MSALRQKVVPIRKGNVTASRLDDEEFLNQARLECYYWDAKVLAEEAGVTKSTIYAFRAGRTVWPRKSTLFPLLEALGYELRLIKVR